MDQVNIYSPLFTNLKKGQSSFTKLRSLKGWFQKTNTINILDFVLAILIYLKSFSSNRVDLIFLLLNLY